MRAVAPNPRLQGAMQGPPFSLAWAPTKLISLPDQRTDDGFQSVGPDDLKALFQLKRFCDSKLTGAGKKLVTLRMVWKHTPSPHAQHMLAQNLSPLKRNHHLSFTMGRPCQLLIQLLLLSFLHFSCLHSQLIAALCKASLSPSELTLQLSSLSME